MTMQTIRKHKWRLYWSGLIVLIVLMVCLFWQVDGSESTFQKQLELAIESLGAFCGVYLALIIFLKSRDDMARQDRERSQHQEKLHEKQIAVLLNSTDHQIEAFRNIVREQTRVLSETLENSGKSANGTRAAEEVRRTYELSRIDYELDKCAFQLKEEEAKLKEIEEFHFLRPMTERTKQIAAQKKVIRGLKTKQDDLKKERKDWER